MHVAPCSRVDDLLLLGKTFHCTDASQNLLCGRRRSCCSRKLVRDVLLVQPCRQEQRQHSAFSPRTNSQQCISSPALALPTCVAALPVCGERTLPQVRPQLLQKGQPATALTCKGPELQQHERQRRTRECRELPRRQEHHNSTQDDSHKGPAVTKAHSHARAHMSCGTRTRQREVHRAQSTTRHVVTMGTNACVVCCCVPQAACTLGAAAQGFGGGAACLPECHRDAGCCCVLHCTCVL